MSHIISVFDTKPYDKQFLTEANKDFGFDLKFLSPHLNSHTYSLANGSEVVCAFVNDVMDKATLEGLKNNGTKLIALRCAGYNNVDLKVAYGNLHVVRVPSYSVYSVAEHAAALLLCLNRKIHRAYNRVRDGNFTLNGLIGFDLHGKTAGIIGTGKIGRCLIDILKGFGMKVLLYDAFPDQKYAKDNNLTYVDLPELCRQADVISLHCPLTPQTQQMINKESLSWMKSGVILLNTGRGKLIDTQALIEALKAGRIGAAGLDVYEEENEYFFEDFSSQVVSDDVLARLMTFPNVLITSHQAFFTVEAMTNIARTTLSNIRSFLDSDILSNEICYKCGQECVQKKKGRCF